MNNQDLKSKYDEMHAQGASAWFGTGEEERALILEMGEPWEESDVLEIGCGEGDLVERMALQKANPRGVDYSDEAIKKARVKYPNREFHHGDYKSVSCTWDRLVLQGVLEHLDDPFGELKWMMDNLLGKTGDVITSSPCFLNTRGIVWMALNMAGAVMSKTDLHYLDPWDFQDFCTKNGYKFDWDTCDHDWGNHRDMITDLAQRIPLALKDGGIRCDRERMVIFLRWLERVHLAGAGATAVYRISKTS